MLGRFFGAGRDSKPSDNNGRKILVPVDDSEHSVAALEWAVKNVLSEKDQLHIVAVAPPVAGPYTPEAPETDVPGPSKQAVEQWKHELHEVEDETRQLLLSCQQRAQQWGVPSARLKIAALPPHGGASGVGASILEYSQSGGASMVVLGSRGMGGLKRSLMNIMGLGSVSDYMLQHARCPVVVVKPAGEAAAGAPAAGSGSSA